MLLKAHWKVFSSGDFFNIEVWTGRRLVTHYVLFMIRLTDRIVRIAGVTTQPDEAWMFRSRAIWWTRRAGRLRRRAT